MLEAITMIIKKLISLGMSYLDYMIIALALASLEVILTALLVKTKSVNSDTGRFVHFSEIQASRSHINTFKLRHSLLLVVLFLFLTMFTNATLYVKYAILQCSYKTALNTTGLEIHLVSLIYTSFLILLALILLNIKFPDIDAILLILVVIAISYFFNMDIYSPETLTDRRLASNYIVSTGRYVSGLLNVAYDPIPFDVVIYTVLALTTGMNPLKSIIFSIYPIITLSLLFIIVWSLLARQQMRQGSTHTIISEYKIILFQMTLLQMSSILIGISNHEALSTAWLFVTFSIYFLLKIVYENLYSVKSLLAIIMFAMCSMFYHVTSSLVLLPLVVFIFMVFVINRKIIKTLFYIFIIIAITAQIKNAIVSKYIIEDFIKSVTLPILSLQLREEASIYVRSYLYSSADIFLRYAQVAQFLPIAVAISALIYYSASLLYSTKNEKAPPSNKSSQSFGLAFIISGFITFLLSLVGLFMGGVFSTVFIRPSLYLMLIGSIPYIANRSKLLRKYVFLLLTIAMIYFTLVSIAANDIGLTPRRSIYSYFSYTNEDDFINLEFISNSSGSLLLIGPSQASMYNTYLAQLTTSKLYNLGSEKNLRDVYNMILSRNEIPKELNPALYLTQSSIETETLVNILNTCDKVYDSFNYVAHICVR